MSLSRGAVEKGSSMKPGQAILVSGALAMFERLVRLVERIVAAMEQEPDLDSTYVVAGTVAAASVFQIQIPRTIHHAELTLSAGLSDTTKTVALFTGSLALLDAQRRHDPTAPGASGSVLASQGNTATARDNLDQSGLLTVLVTGACTFCANVRIRDLDKSQTRAART